MDALINKEGHIQYNGLSFHPSDGMNDVHDYF